MKMVSAENRLRAQSDPLVIRTVRGSTPYLASALHSTNCVQPQAIEPQ